MNHTIDVEKSGTLELIVKRKFSAPVAKLFAAWSTAAHMQQWWAPASFGMDLSCNMDVRMGGSYRFEYAKDGQFVMAFFGKYLEVVPGEKLVWTNEESEGGAVTTVRFTPDSGGTLITLSEAHQSQEARDESCAGMEGMSPEQFMQLDSFLERLST